MNGDVNTWERQSTGGAKGFYDDEGNYLGFTSQDGSWWPNIPGTPKPGSGSVPTGTGGPDQQDKYADYCARNPWALDCLIFGTPTKPGPGALGGQAGNAAVGAAKVATDWISGQFVGIAIIAIGGLFLFTGLQGLMKQ